MRGYLKYFTAICLCLLLLCGCSREKEPSSGAEILTDTDTRFLIVTLEGTDADIAKVQVIKSGKNEAGELLDEKIYDMVPTGENQHCVAVDEGGNYLILVLVGEERRVSHFAVLDESKICSFHLCMDKKPQGSSRTLWPETPHNTPDVE